MPNRKPPRRKPPSQRRTDPTPEESIRTITRMLVAHGRDRGEDDGAIRERIKHAINEALHGTKQWMDDKMLPGQDTPKTMVTTAGMYRMIFARHNIDRSDMHGQERWQSIVMDEMERTIERRDGEYRRR